MSNHVNCISIHLTDEEAKRLEEVWRSDLTVKSRSDFIKTAINQHAKRTICLPQRRGFTNKLAE